MITEYIPLTATAASLAMDAFSVSICVGLCNNDLKKSDALMLGGAFGFFQFFMPLIGAEMAEHLEGIFDVWTPWIAAALITWVAVSMIKESHQGDGCKESSLTMTFKSVTLLAFATSLDALAVGFSIKSTGGSAWFLAIAAGVITFSFSVFGSLGGGILGHKAGNRAELAGGCVLLLIAAKIVWGAI